VAGLLSLRPGSLHRPSAFVKPRACGADDDDSTDPLPLLHRSPAPESTTFSTTSPPTQTGKKPLADHGSTCGPTAQIKEIEQHQVECVKHASTEKLEAIAKLARLRGIGVPSSWVLVMESFGWRKFRNRKEVGGSVGLVGTPYDSGESNRELGISKAGNARLRSLLVELAWLWVRYQPESTITKWYMERYGGQGKRSKRVGIVGVARRLMIQLWHYVEHDVEPPGAIIAKS
jgi:hypothetical protein